MSRALLRSERATAGLAVVIVLVILQLLLVGVMIGGARDQDMAVHRLNTVRAGYAVEAGENMALRELMINADLDADGGIGTISNDGIPGNDPALGSAQFTVSSSSSGGQTTLASKGRVAGTRAQAQLVTEPAPGTSMAVWSRGGSNQPRFAEWTSGAWGPNTAMPSVGAEAKFVRAVHCPTRDDVFFAAEDLNMDTNVVVFNGTSWGTAVEVCNNSSTRDDRAFDIGYEQLSGDGLIVYWNETQNQLGYRTWNGSSLSGESLLSLPGATRSRYVTLYPRPGGNQIILLAANDNGAKRLSAAVWSGSSWGAWTHLETDLETDQQECYGLAFESISRTAVVIYTEDSVMTPRYRTWNGSSWSSESSMPSVGQVPRWVRVASAPTSDQILYAGLDTDNDINVNVWDGSSWGANLQVETATAGYQPRQVDVSYERGTGNALLVYSESGQNQPRYRTWNGSSWSAEQLGPSIGAKSWFVHLIPGTAVGEVMVAIADDIKDLHLLRWTGSTLTGHVEIETALGSLSSGAEPAMLTLPPGGWGSGLCKVVSWKCVQPQ